MHSKIFKIMVIIVNSELVRILNERKKTFNSYRINPSIKSEEYVFTEKFEDIIGNFDEFKQVDFVAEKDDKSDLITAKKANSNKHVVVVEEEKTLVVENDVLSKEESAFSVDADKGVNIESGKTRTYSQRMKQGFFKKSRR